jgi:cobalt-zinc-cadmium efflux system outer membrane protein
MHLLLVRGLFALSMAQGPDTLTIDDALARARATRPRVAAASAIVERAIGAARVGAIIPNPTAQFEADDLEPIYKLTATQPLAWLARRGADLAAGRAGVERARADSAQTLADMGRDVRRSFFGALAADRQLALATEQSALADSLARLAARRAAAGDISDLERDQISLEASRARLAAEQARQSAAVARAELARAVAWESAAPPRAVGALDEGLKKSRSLAALGTTASLGTTSIDALPFVRGAVADSTAAAARLRAARIARIPIPGLVAGREWGSGTGSNNLILGLAIPIPIFSQGGEAVHQARGAAAELSALAAESRLTARAQLEAARARTESSDRRARFARDSLLPEAVRVRAGAVRLYEEGRTSVLPVLDALRAEREVARATVAELLAFQEARADLYAVLGRWP